MAKRKRQLSAVPKLNANARVMPTLPCRRAGLMPVAIIVGFVVGAAASTIIAHGVRWGTESISTLPEHPQQVTLGDLLTMSPEQLATTDIAMMNLLCAQGLPGAEKLNINACLATLDQWAKRVKSETERHVYRVSDQRYADHYQHSEAKYRAEMLVQVMQEDLGIHYNMERVAKVDFTNSKDLFIHGLVDDKNGGTCMSMPVMYIAIARRLGYPVKLVEAKSHLFCRWEDAGPEGKPERFNFDGAGSGFSIHEDDFYQNWPRSISADEIARGEYLKTLTAGEELAAFLAARGHCLLDNGNVLEAQTIYSQAHRLNPSSRDYFGFLVDSVQRELMRPTVAVRTKG